MHDFKIQEHQIPASYIREYYRSLADEHDDDLRLAVRQYSPLDNPAPHDGDLTIIGAHGNGFPKEMYEPMWDDIYRRLKDLGHRIRNIFIMDMAWQGRSGVMNASKLGNDPSWIDSARDILMMINHFRTEIKQPIIGIGHSMGGTVLVNVADMHPRLFTSLILIDPVIMQYGHGPQGKTIAAASSVRRNRWPTRAAAETSFKKSKYYQAWDPRVLDMWFKHGLREVPNNENAASKGSTDDPEVVLVTAPSQEVFTFFRPGVAVDNQPSPYPQPGLPRSLTHPDLDWLKAQDGEKIYPVIYRPEIFSTFARLATLRPSVLFVFAEKSDLSLKELNDDKMAVTGTGPGGSGGAKAGRVKGHMIKSASHAVPFEDPAAVAEVCIAWIVPELARYSEETALLRRDWDKVPKDQKTAIPEGVAKLLKSFLPQRPPKRPNSEETKSSKL